MSSRLQTVYGGPLFAACRQLFRQFPAAVFENRLDCRNDRAEFIIQQQLAKPGRRSCYRLFAVMGELPTPEQVLDAYPLPVLRGPGMFRQLYALRSDDGQVTHTVGWADHQLHVRPIADCSYPPEVKDLDLAGFWQLVKAGRLQASSTHHLETGWLWRGAGYVGFRPVLAPKPPALLTPRGPLELHQNDRFTCLGCSTANILWMYECSDARDQSDVEAMFKRDRRVASPLQAVLVLLRHGLKVTHISDYRIRHADDPEYMRGVYGEHWSRHESRHFRSQTWSRICRDLQRQTHVYGEQVRAFRAYRRIDRRPTWSDLRYRLRQGQIILTSTWGKRAGILHAVVVVGAIGSSLIVYSPMPDWAPTLYLVRRDEWLKRWRPGFGAYAVSHDSP